MCVCVILLALYYSRPSLRLLLFFTGASFRFNGCTPAVVTSLSTNTRTTLKSSPIALHLKTRQPDPTLWILCLTARGHENEAGMGTYISRDYIHAGAVSLKLMDAPVTRGRGKPPSPFLPKTLVAEPNFRLVLFLSIFFRPHQPYYNSNQSNHRRQISKFSKNVNEAFFEFSLICSTFFLFF